MTDWREWLEADGLGGYASGTACGIRTRRYHALVLAATTPPTGRMVLVQGFDAFVTTAAGTFALTSQRYLPPDFSGSAETSEAIGAGAIIHPDGAARIERFHTDPFPTWHFLLDDGTRIEQQIFVLRGAPVAIVCFRLIADSDRAGSAGPVGHGAVHLTLRPFVSGREDHHLHHENPDFDFRVDSDGERHRLRPYPGGPAIAFHTSGAFRSEPLWYRRFFYAEEAARGLDAVEDLASPGVFEYQLGAGPALLIARAELTGREAPLGPVASFASRARAVEEARRAAFAGELSRAADAYLVERGSGATIVAGYPWFTDWGRDTFISLRGLCLATGRLDEARRILIEWSGAVSEGMLPNRFPDRGETPEYNSVDASLWFVIAAAEYLAAVAAVPPAAAVAAENAADRAGTDTRAADRELLENAVRRILDGYMRGTRYGIALDEDGLIRAGVPGVALTWMDARVDDWVVTPRIGKPVEIQALWLNALQLFGALSPAYPALVTRGLRSFRARFWNDARGCLHDVVDEDHRPGALDSSIRPNQIFAVAGLPLPLLPPARCRQVIDLVEARLLTPLGLRTLDPADPAYRPHYRGSRRERDAAYHQGTVWPWLLGPFVEAWVRVRGSAPAVLVEARRRFLDPLVGARESFGLQHLPEVADGEAPHRPGGCPFQAWSLAEALRLDRVVLAL